ncbi:MAG TPA: GDSL-type esterase/lipase family protein [Microbacterium sp.]|nr:GDSL-type esterase/lipase family protein [Microbacterium sp.]
MSSRIRARRAIAALVTAAVLVTGGVVGTSGASAAPPLPAKMAAMGDSISQALMTCSSLRTCTPNSWTVGTTASVNSHASRLRAMGAPLTTYNNAVSGVKAASLPAQASASAAQGATYVTVQIGANDACTSTVAGMTPTASFDASVRSALATLAASPAQPDIFVSSIPNIKRLWEVNRTSSSARLTWALLGLCRSMLANPGSTSATDMARRDAVQARVNEFNAVLAAACAATAKCVWDNNAVANYTFTRADISTRDYFHPSLAGQAVLANVTWAASQWVR